MWLVVNDFRKLSINYPTLESVMFPCKLCLWKRDERNEIFVPQAHGFHSSLFNHQERAFCTCIILHFVILLKHLQRHQFYWSEGPLHFAPYSYSQPERSMEIIIKQSLSLMWFNKVPLKNNNAEDSEGVLHQPFLAVWSRLNVYCTTAQRI